MGEKAVETLEYLGYCRHSRLVSVVVEQETVFVIVLEEGRLYRV